MKTMVRSVVKSGFAVIQPQGALLPMACLVSIPISQPTSVQNLPITDVAIPLQSVLKSAWF